MTLSGVLLGSGPIGKRRVFWGAWCAAVALQLILIWALPVLPGQDLPQHLANVRILLDYERPDLPFGDFYELPEDFQSYFTTYAALVTLGWILSLEAALRILLSLYAVGVFVAFRALVVALRPPSAEEPPWTALAACALVWSPVACMGFLQFMMAVPVFIYAAALFFRVWLRRERPRDLPLLLVACGLTASLHVVAAGALALLFVVHWACDRKRARPGPALLALTALVVTSVVWSQVGTSGLGKVPTVDWDEAVNRSMGFEVVNELFRITWYDPPTTLSYAFWTLLGPYRFAGQVLMAVVIGTGALIIRAMNRSAPSKASPDDSGVGSVRRTVIVFSILAALLPWGLHVPTEITFLNFRMLTLAFGLALALIPSRVFATGRAAQVLMAMCAFLVGKLAYSAAAFSLEAQPVVDLMGRAEPRGVMTPVVFADRTRHFGKLFRMAHNLPMYYTVRYGGISTQFWARYTDHLPIGYKPGKDPTGPPDWKPWEFRLSDAARADYVLLVAATEESTRRDRTAYERARLEVSRSMKLMACHEGWCLYRR